MTGVMTSLHTLSATTLSGMMARGDVSVVEVTDAFLARIAAHNDALQAFVHVAAFRARRRARALDAARRRGDFPLSPLAGVPMGIKDLYPVRLMPMRGGSRALGPIITPFDAVNVARLRAAGVVMLGKLATSEFGAMPFTEPDVHAPTRNPWDLSTTSGGSSGGTAAATAAGLVPLGHGSDGGGSIRIPAALCGLFGFKAGRGALVHNSPTERLHLATEGPLAHTVDDATAMLQLLATDARFARPAVLPTGLRVRIAVDSSEPALAPTAPVMAQAALHVASLLQGLGHHVDETGPVPLGLPQFLPLWQRTLAWVPVPSMLEHRLQPITRWLRQAGKDISEATAFSTLDQITAVVDGWWGDADLFVSPAVTCLPPAVGSWRRDDPAEAFNQAVPLAVFTAAFNASGQPAMTIPVRLPGMSQPVGVQVVARRGDDALLLAVARVLEGALGGLSHRPPAFR